MKKKIKYGIVGSGLMGCEHISNINLIDSAEVVAISDSNENSINKAKNLISNDIKIYSNNNINQQSLIRKMSPSIFLQARVIRTSLK